MFTASGLNILISVVTAAHIRHEVLGGDAELVAVWLRRTVIALPKVFYELSAPDIRQLLRLGRNQLIDLVLGKVNHFIHCEDNLVNIELQNYFIAHFK